MIRWAHQRKDGEGKVSQDMVGKVVLLVSNNFLHKQHFMTAT